MSVERDVLKPSTGQTTTVAASKESEGAIDERAQEKARLLRVLSRGMVQDTLNVELPADVYGEWVPKDPLEIYRMEAMGFKRDTEYASKMRLHSDGTDNNVVGDVIFMTCSKQTKEIIDEIRREQYIAAHGKPQKVSHEVKEEKEFSASTDLPVASEGSTIPVNADQIRSAISNPS